MSEEKETKTPDAPDAEDSGKESDQEKTERTFTQEEVDHHIKTRLARQKEQFSDYDELKGKEKELDEIHEARKTETEKLQSKLDKEIEAREAAEAQSEKTAISAAFIAAASQAGVKHPQDAYALADHSLILIEEGKVTGVEEAVKLLVDNGRLPLMAKPPAPNLDGGAGKNDRSGDVTKLTPEQKDMAANMNISPQDYADNLNVKTVKKE